MEQPIYQIINLSFKKNLEYKFLDLLSLDFVASNEEVIR